MRFKEIVLESNYVDELKDEIINLLTVASSRGIKNLRTSFLINDLRNLGFEVDADNISTILNDIDIVSNADSKKIEISTDTSPDPENVDVPDFGNDNEASFGGFDDDANNVDPVDAAAKRQASKDIKL